ncbi:MAG: hypothetical protein R3362_01175 [Rhodothermales bacterium]|nr:hypothetical protein [Rhodothermales bacterium]
MDVMHLHLALNHAPLFAVLFGAAGLLYALLVRSDGALRATLSLLVLGGLLVLPVYLTGEAAEEAVEHLEGVSEAAIEAHEAAALGAALAVAALGLLALGGLLGFRRRPVARPFALVLLVLTLGVGGWVGYTANLGGQINHPELRDGAALDGDAPARYAPYDDDD